MLFFFTQSQNTIGSFLDFFLFLDSAILSNVTCHVDMKACFAFIHHRNHNLFCALKVAVGTCNLPVHPVSLLGSDPLHELWFFSSCPFADREPGDGESSTGHPNCTFITKEATNVCA